ncbi:MAG: uroporphyrinogen-III synthase [Alphaproteobacteria bacterium]|nr:uroporphyrinogen-III synthase [Alphaproteobacteria bacterium]MDE2073406.1 uroporphyrinogen-III synthase [Alphaproteobacteria bacterium]
MRVLVTRPLEDAERTATELQARGHQTVLAPLMDIRFRPGPELALGGVQAILVTSANGVRALAGRSKRRDLPVFAVGPQSAEVARKEGFADVKSANGDAVALAEAVKGWARPEAGALFHAAGAQTKGDLAARLSAAGFTVQSEAVYEAVPAEALPPPASAALADGGIDAVLLYSPRSARTLVACLKRAGLAETARGLIACCISKAAAEALGGLPFKAVRSAAHPDQNGLFALLD